MNVRRRCFGIWIGFIVVGAVAGTGPGCTGDHGTTILSGVEAGPPKEGGSVTPRATCPTDTPVDPTALLWASPKAPQDGRCQDADLAAMKDFFVANPTATNEDFENFVKNRSPSCHDCVFGDAAGSRWPPAPVNDGKVVTFNVGACYALTTGSDACGLAVQNAWDCGFAACVECDSQKAVQACRVTARAGVCKPYEAKAHAECGVTSADQVCGSPFDSIRIQCVTAVPPVTDGGTETGDAGDGGDAADADAGDAADQ